jgi:ornithine carbamoyltransferase
MRTQTLHNTQAVRLSGVKNDGFTDLVSMKDLSPQQVRNILDLAAMMKARPSDFRAALAGKQMALFFEKPSLRTRLTFESGMASLGGVSFFFDQTSSPIDAREDLSDVAHNLERWVDIIVLRTFAHQTVQAMADYACIPVVNALSDFEHPCQALADYFTLQQHFGGVRELKLAYVGDGNNVAHSLLLAGAALGSTIRVATPSGYEPSADVAAHAREVAGDTGATIEFYTDPQEAVSGVDAIYTDVWASMGQEKEAEQRAQIFAPYQVNKKLMALAAPHAVFMHCLPAHRGQEVAASVINSSRSIVFDQAESRLHVQKAILLLLLGGGTSRLPIRSAHA